MNTIHHTDIDPSDFESETTTNQNLLMRRLKLSAAALMFVIPTGMYADNIVDETIHSLQNIDPNVLEDLPAK